MPYFEDQDFWERALDELRKDWLATREQVKRCAQLARAYGELDIKNPRKVFAALMLAMEAELHAKRAGNLQGLGELAKELQANEEEGSQ